MPNLRILKRILPLAALLVLAACASDGSKRTAPGPTDQAAIDKAQAEFQARANDSPNGIVKDGQFVTAEGEGGSKELGDPGHLTLATDQIKLDQPRDPKAALEHRAIERWALLIAKQGNQAFGYLTPGYQQSHDRDRYHKEMATRPVLWLRAAYSDADCRTESSCEVHVRLDYKVHNVGMAGGPPELSAFAMLAESWLKVDGVWYHLPRETGG